MSILYRECVRVLFLFTILSFFVFFCYGVCSFNYLIIIIDRGSKYQLKQIISEIF